MEVDDYGGGMIDEVQRQTLGVENQIRLEENSEGPLLLLEGAARIAMRESTDEQQHYREMFVIKYTIPRFVCIFLRRYHQYTDRLFKLKVRSALEQVARVCAFKIDRDIPEIYDILAKLFSFDYYSLPTTIDAEDRKSWSKQQRLKELNDREESDHDEPLLGDSLASFSDLESDSDLDDPMDILNEEDEIVKNWLRNIAIEEKAACDAKEKDGPVRSKRPLSAGLLSEMNRLDGTQKGKGEDDLEDEDDLEGENDLQEEDGSEEENFSHMRLHGGVRKNRSSVRARRLDPDEDGDYLAFPVDHIMRASKDLGEAFADFFAIVNAFGKAGGFRRILEKIRQQQGGSCSTYTIRSLLFAPNKLGWLMSMDRPVDDAPSLLLTRRTTGRLANFALKARRATYEALMSMTDKELKAQNKAMLREAFVLATDFRAKAHIVPDSEGNLHSQEAIKEAREAQEFQLLFALKKIKSSFLELRLFGIFELKNKITRAIPRQNRADIQAIPTRIQDNTMTKASREPEPLATDDQADGSMGNGGALGDNEFQQNLEQEYEMLGGEIACDVLSKSLIDLGIVEILFDHSRLHVEVIKRSGEVLEFLSTNRVLAQNHIDTVWSATKHTHESIKHAVYNIAVELPRVLPRRLTEHLWSHIESIPLSNYDDHTVFLVGSFTMAAMSTNAALQSLTTPVPKRLSEECNSDTTGWFGVTVLWKIIQLDTSDVDATVFESAFERLSDYLQRKEFASRREPMIRNCVENIRHHRAMPQSLTLLKTLIGTYAPSNTTNNGLVREDLASVIQWLERECHLLDLVVNDFVTYTHGLFLMLKQSNERGLGESKNVMDGDFCSRTNHIKERFSFLSYYITRMTLIGQAALSPSHIDGIWNCTINDKIGEFECEQAFIWLEKLSSAFDQATTGPSLIDYIFETKLRKMDLVNMTASAGSCFSTYFRLVNERSANLAIVGVDRQTPVVLTDQLRGMDSLWKIAIDTVNEDVGTKIGEFIVKLHQDLDQRLASHIRDKVAEFVDICMRRFGEAVEILESNKQNHLHAQTLYAAAHRRVQRCVRLLQMFLDEFEGRINKAGGKIALRHGSAAVGRRINIAVIVFSGERFVIPSHSNETLGALRRRISERLKTSGVRLISGGRELREDGKSLGELRIHDKQTLHVTSRAHLNMEAGDGSDKAAPLPIRPQTLLGSISEDSYPSRLLCDEKYFGLFFRMLDLECQSEGETSSVWQLLMRIPTNQSIVDMLKNPSKIDNWETVLHRGSPFRLFYTLQIIQALCQDESRLHNSETEYEQQESEAVDVRKADPWRDEFLKSDGVVHLLEVLMQENFLEEPHRDRRRSCLSLLLHLINRFSLKAIRPADEAGSVTSAFQSAPTLSDAGMALFPETVLRGVVVKLLDISASLAASEENASQNSFASLLFRESDDNGRDIVLTPVVELIVASVTSSTSNVEWFCTSREYELWLRRILIGCVVAKRRRAAATSVELLAIACPESRHLLLSRLLNMMNDVCNLDITDSYRCAEYFELNRHLLGHSLHDLPKDKIDVVYCNTVRRIVTMPTRERADNEMEDSVLNGLLGLACTLISLRKELECRVGSRVAACDSRAKEDKSAGDLEIDRERFPTFEDKGFVDEIFDRCLFGVPTAKLHGHCSLPKAKTSASRRAAFRVLLELCSVSKGYFLNITDRLLAVHKRARIAQTGFDSGSKAMSEVGRNEKEFGADEIGELEHINGSHSYRMQWNYSPAVLNKSLCGYVGLKNLGTTCYMNSVVQQLFMIPSFREGILRAPVPSDAKSEPDAILYNLQKLFGYLLLSEKKYFDTREFCSVYRDYDNRPMNTAMQMDVDEFLNMLFDKLERAVRGGPEAHILEDSFCGTLVNQVICQEVEYKSERQEKFFVLSLEVKNKKSVEESLNFYVQGEILDGDNKYYCEPFKRKVAAVKRTCLGSLPQNLILHLKRFEFDYDLMRKVKVNQKCEFPYQLDLYPYTKEALDGKEEARNSTDPPPQYLYNLVGILVHIGTADSGHYYSFIQERSSKKGDQPEWFQFNDIHTEPFDPKNIPSTCYGGYEPLNRWEPDAQQNTQHLQAKQDSAYMLFYERCTSTETQEGSNMKGFTDEKYCANGGNSVKHDKACGSLVPNAIYNEVWHDNEIFFNDKHLFDPDYADFMRDLVRIPMVSERQHRLFGIPFDTPSERDLVWFRLVEIGARFVLDALCRSSDKSSLVQWEEQIRILLEMTKSGSSWMLKVCAPEYSYLFLVECAVQEARFLYQTCVVNAMNVLYDRESNDTKQNQATPLDCPLDSLTEPSMDADTSKEVCTEAVQIPSNIISYIDHLLRMLEKCNGYNQPFCEYFDILSNFAQSIGMEARRYLLSHDLVHKLCQSYIGDQVALAALHQDADSSPHDNRTKMRNSGSLSNISSMARLLAILVRSTIDENGRSVPPTLIDKKPLANLRGPGFDLLMSDKFWINILRHCYHDDALKHLTEHLCWESEECTYIIGDVAIGGLDKANWGNFKPYLAVVSSLLRLSDSLKPRRIDATMIQYMNMLAGNSAFLNATVYGLRFLVQEVKATGGEMLAGWLVENGQYWIPRFLLYHERLQVRGAADELLRALATEYPVFVTPLTSIVIVLLPDSLKILKRCREEVSPNNGAEETFSSLRGPEYHGRVFHVVHLLLGLVWEEQRLAQGKPIETVRGQIRSNTDCSNGRESVRARTAHTQYQKVGVSRSRLTERSEIPVGCCKSDNPALNFRGLARMRHSVPHLLQMLSAVDSLGIECDDSKDALLDLLEHMCRDKSIAFEVTTAQNRADKLLSLKFDLGLQNREIQFTNKVLAKYFSILWHVANANLPFLRIASCHPNIIHLMSTTFLEQPYRPLVSELLSFMGLCGRELLTFRFQYVDLILHKVRKHAKLTSNAKVGDLLETMSKVEPGHSRNPVEDLEKNKQASNKHGGTESATMRIRSLAKAASASLALQLLPPLLGSQQEVRRFLELNGLDLPMGMLVNFLEPRGASSTKSTQLHSKDELVQRSGLVTEAEGLFLDCSKAATLIQHCNHYCPALVGTQLFDIHVLAEACLQVVGSVSLGHPIVVDLVTTLPPGRNRGMVRNLQLEKCLPLMHCLMLFGNNEPAILRSLAMRFMHDFHTMNVAPRETMNTSEAVATQYECANEVVDGESGKLSPATSESREQLSRLALNSNAENVADSQPDSECRVEETGDSSSKDTGNVVSPVSSVRLPGYASLPEISSIVANILTLWMEGCAPDEIEHQEKILTYMIPGVLFNMVLRGASDFTQVAKLGNSWLSRCNGNNETNMLRLFGLIVMRERVVQVVQSDDGVELVARLLKNAESANDELDMEKLSSSWVELAREHLAGGTIHLGVLGGILVLAKAGAHKLLDLDNLMKDLESLARESDIINRRLAAVKEACGLLHEDVVMETQHPQKGHAVAKGSE